MKIFLLGGTGRTGQQFIDLALAGGHQVTAFVRSPWKVRRHEAGLRVVEGDPRDAEVEGQALVGHDALVSALGPEPRRAMTGSTLLRDCAAATVTAMRATGVERVAVVSSALLFPGGGLAVKLARSLIRPHLQDSEQMELLFGQSGLRWTIARPPRLVHSPDASYRAVVGQLPVALTVRAWLSWRGVASFLLDCIVGRTHSDQVVGISH
jgi:putative NADH-flavin reductase